jgi:primary-amine oxidase
MRSCPTQPVSRTEIKNAICLHEEDNAVLWRHRRGRVPRCGSVGWWCPATSPSITMSTKRLLALHQDGNIECEVRATGTTGNTPFAEGARPPFGMVVDDRTTRAVPPALPRGAPRPDIDGEANSVGR